MVKKTAKKSFQTLKQRRRQKKTGTWTEGKRTEFLLDSIWVFYYENSLVHQKIAYKKNERNGLLTIYNNKGALLEETTYKDDEKNGKSIIYQPIDSGYQSYKIQDLI